MKMAVWLKFFYFMTLEVYIAISIWLCRVELENHKKSILWGEETLRPYKWAVLGGIENYSTIQ